MSKDSSNEPTRLKIVGHRGAAGLAPENSLAAIKAALANNVDEIEFDIRVSKDGVPVLYHNSALSTGQVIRDQTCEALKAADANLATLAEALDAIDTKAKPLVEIKRGEPLPPIIAVLKQFIGGMYGTADIALGSKDQHILRGLRQAFPDVELVVIEPWSGVRGHWRARQVGSTRCA